MVDIMALWPIGLLVVVSLLAGTAAAVVGFGIGSLLTPVVAIHYGADAAVMVVAIPHLVGGLFRGWRLRHYIDRGILFSFGLLSAAGALAGAFIFSRLTVQTLEPILGAVLVLTAILNLGHWSRQWQPDGALVWMMGALSGLSGGMVGNQGGLRAAALSAFRLEPPVFVATSTAIGIIIDCARTPVYLYQSGDTMVSFWPLTALLTAGVVVGTRAGEGLLRRLSPDRFRVIVAGAIGLLGLWLLL